MFRQNKYIVPALIILLAATLLFAIMVGAVAISPNDMLCAVEHWCSGKKPGNIEEGVFLQIRLPRVFLCAVTGAGLAASGVLMQGLLRNPVVEPGLTGTSSGAAFGASIVFVLEASMSNEMKVAAGTFLLPLFAFAGGLLATFIVYTLAENKYNINVTSLLLIGISINAVGLSGTGFMSYMARDPQARSITFWNLGTFTGATWQQVFITSIAVSIAGFISFRYAKQLNVLMLGEQEAKYLGVNVRRLKRKIIILNTAMVSITTAFTGVIAFMGLIVPHIMRIIVGSDHRKLLPASAIAGAILLTFADIGARCLLAPAEIPIGIITSVVGAPVFIVLLKKTDMLQNKGGDYA